jgi:MFS family permease
MSDHAVGGAGAGSGLRYSSSAGRWVLVAAVLGSGMALLDGTVVNVALRTIGRDLDASLAQLQWISNGYLLSLASLILLGGSLGDHFDGVASSSWAWSGSRSRLSRAEPLRMPISSLPRGCCREWAPPC